MYISFISLLNMHYSKSMIFKKGDLIVKGVFDNRVLQIENWIVYIYMPHFIRLSTYMVGMVCAQVRACACFSYKFIYTFYSFLFLYCFNTTFEIIFSLRTLYLVVGDVKDKNLYKV